MGLRAYSCFRLIGIMTCTSFKMLKKTRSVSPFSHFSKMIYFESTTFSAHDGPLMCNLYVCTTTTRKCWLTNCPIHDIISWHFHFWWSSNTFIYFCVYIQARRVGRMNSNVCQVDVVCCVWLFAKLSRLVSENNRSNGNMRLFLTFIHSAIGLSL